MTASIVSAKGWVVIPREIRERYGIRKGTRIRFVDYGGVVRLIPEPGDALEALEAISGKFADEPSLTADLLAERALELGQDEHDFE
ncbi:MAG: AbrB family transcriptional regulator [Anaerolineae bacterium]|nr:MAG: AbrB family transcriptional regulator [Anaerolineae bacterium]